MSWIDTLDRLITDSWMASREESAAMLDNLLALSLAERWDLFATRDSRLMFLSDEDYAVLFNSLNAHTLIANVGEALDLEPVTEEATSVLPDEEAETATRSQAGYVVEAPPAGWAARGGLRGWWRAHRGVRWLTMAGVTVAGLLLAGSALTVTVSRLLPAALSSQPTEALITKLDGVERDQVQLARRLIQVDSRVDDLASNVNGRFNTTLRAVRLTSALDQLQATVDRGDAFVAELGRVTPTVGDNGALTAMLARLEPAAPSGVPTLAALRARFDEISPRLGGSVEIREPVAAGRTSELADGQSQDQNALSRLVGWVGSAFGLIESSETKRFRAVLAGIRASLGLGDLASATSQIAALHAYPASLVTPWLTAARLRLDADTAIAALRQGLLPGPAVALEK